MTDKQKQIFDKRITEFFEMINKEVNGESTEDKNMNKWESNLFNRYLYALSGERPKNKLPKEHLDTLKAKLKENNLTEEEYEKAKGKRKQLALILKEKQTLENYTIEELTKMQQQYDKKINDLKLKNTERYKKLYKLSEEEYIKIEKELEDLINKRKKINNLLEKKQETEEQKTRTSKTYDEKIKELIEQTKRQEETINDLNDTIKEYQQTKQTAQQEYLKKFIETKHQLQAHFDEQLEKINQQLEATYQGKIRQQRQEYNDYIEKTKHELEIKEQEIKRNLKQTKEQQKEIIIKLLCTKDDISINDIKQQLEHKNIPTEGIIEAFKEVKILIPGIVKKISNDGNIFTYSIKNDALRELEQHKNWIVSPKISNVYDGEVSFIVRSDLHLNMTNSDETIRKTLFPCMEYCAKKGNIPIIDLGDLAETIVGIKYDSWKNLDKNAIKLACKFYKNYAKAISSSPEISHYILFGNHDEHPYYAGIDPLEILLEYSNNFKTLGVSSGSFQIGNDKIGVFHDKSWQNIIRYNERNKNERDEYIYEYLCEEMKEIAQNYIYSLMGHYHFGKHNPEHNFSVITNGIENPLLFTAQVKDGQVEKMFVTELYTVNNGKQLKNSSYQTEIYNRGKQFIKY